MHPMRKFAGLGLLLSSWRRHGVQAAGWKMEGGRIPSPKREQDLIAVLHSDVPKAKKADACKDLAVYGSEKAVPELESCSPTNSSASWARIARGNSRSRRGPGPANVPRRCTACWPWRDEFDWSPPRRGRRQTAQR